MANVFKTRHPRWLRRGIRCVGNWEPLHFRRRAGNMSVEPYGRELYEGEHTEETVLRLKKMGVNMVITHFYKGMGIQAERPEMERSIEFARLCHRHGLMCAGYCQWATLGHETFFKEEPRAMDWIQVRADGQPVTLTYGHQPFRYMPCFNRDEYRAYYHRVLEMAVKEAKFDLIHMDNCGVRRPPPECCYCEDCQAQFTAFLLRKYDLKTPRGRELAMQRFGHTHLDMIKLPVFSAFIRPQDLAVVKDPGTQEWVEFWTDRMEAYVGEAAALIRRLNPQCAVEINCGLASGYSRPFIQGEDDNRTFHHIDVAWSEAAHNQAHLAEDGRLVSQIRSFKRARSLDTVLFTYTGARGDTSPERQRLVMAEALAYNAPTLGCLGGVGGISAETCPYQKDYIDFFLKHERFYVDAETVADVAVLTNYHTLAHVLERPHLEGILVEQTLIQKHVPFDIIYDSQLRDLSKYRVLILPDVQWIADEHAAQIKAYVRKGGGLVITSDTGASDHWGRTRPTRAFDDLLGIAPSSRPRSLTLKQNGNARVAFLPRVEPVRPFEIEYGKSNDYQHVTNDHWHLPKNAAEILDAVRWAAGGHFSIEVTAPQTMTAEFMRQPKTGRRIIHLVNFDLERDIPGVGLELTAGTKPKSIRTYSPEDAPARGIAPSTDFLVPGFRRYRMVVLG